jgi:hypothetical protein
MTIPLWNIANDFLLITQIERFSSELALPVANGLNGIEIELISGNLPTGTRIEGTKIVGAPYEVATDTVFTFVLRAHWLGNFDDRTLKIVVTGPDAPVWQTPSGLLPIGNNNQYFILDNEIIDFQLLATDNDLPAGDELRYFIADGDGNLPPGVTLTEDGRLTGVVEPLLSLDKRFSGGGYDTMPYGDFPLDYSVLSSNGYGSYFYDTVTFDYSIPTQSLRKLNRYYPFAVTVTDGETFVRRQFKIYVVGDDFLRVDNTIMQVSTGVFTADNTYVRTPVWITPRNLGFKRANNYVTVYLDVLESNTLLGQIVYTLDNINDDGSVSELPPGLALDSTNGELYGRVPYQPAITQNYKFTIRATRYTGDLESLTIFANFYEDVLLGATSFKIFKIDRTSTLDGVEDLRELLNTDIILYGRPYRVIGTSNSNPNYDVITVSDTIAPSVSLNLSKTASMGDDHIFVNTLSEQNKNKCQGRELRFSTSEVYKITSVVPYIEYEIRQTEPAFNPILPKKSPRNIIEFENYFIGDYAVYTSESGGDDQIYICTVPHNVQPQYDINNEIVTDGLGNVQIDFESAKWNLVAATLSDLSLNDRLTATRQALQETYGGVSYIEVIEPTRWRIRIPSTAISRIKSNVLGFFRESTDSSELTVILIRDNEDRLGLDVNLSRQLLQGRNIGIALFKNDFFTKNIAVTSTDEVDIPSKAKTFELQIIGEIDSTIKWLTDPYLGKINANFTSVLRVEAETTVPDTRMLYAIKSGQLPFGMRLNYSGEIIGVANQFANASSKGLTTFDNRTITWDGKNPGDTLFDRRYKFVIEARDRFNYSAITREFTLDVEDLDDTLYTDIVARPMLKQSQRDLYKNFISNPEIFTPNNIYRQDDPRFGLQKTLELLVYAGIEAKNVENFVAAAAKNHKRKKYLFGDFKIALAKQPGSNEIVYEVIYADVIDPAMTSKGKTRKQFKITTGNKITVDSIQYAGVDDKTRTGLGVPQIPVYGREIVKFVYPNKDFLIVETRSNFVQVNTDNDDFIIDIRNNGEITFQLQLTDSEPYRIRPITNTIKADSNAVKVSDTKDQTRYISSIDHMRGNIKAIGKSERNYLPLWMRTPQSGFQELNYQTAIPVCYCKPGAANEILLNIKNSGFNMRNIELDIDRYIVQRTGNNLEEQYILFANYQFNV